MTGPTLRSVLARALVDSNFIARYSDYALRAHPDTMAREPAADLAHGWAGDMLADPALAAAERVLAAAAWHLSNAHSVPLNDDEGLSLDAMRDAFADLRSAVEAR